MKKIITAVAAVAMAASMFALDFKGALKTEGSLFSMNFAEGAKPTVLARQLGGGGNWWGSRMQTSFSADKCGGQFALKLADSCVIDSAQVWIQPVDMLKITMLNTSDKLNESFMDAHEYKVIDVSGAWQFALTPADGVTATVTLADKWINAGDFKDTGFSFKYKNDDIGTIGFMFVGKNNFNNIKLGAGYSNKFDSVEMFADAAVSIGSAGLSGLDADAQIVISADALKLSAYAAYTNTMANSGNANADMGLRVMAKCEYKMDACKPYVIVKSADFLNDTLNMYVQPGVEFNVGAAACDLGAKVTISSATGASNIEVPFAVTVSF